MLLRLTELQARGHDVGVVILRNTFEHRFEEKGISVATVKKGGRLRLSERAGVARAIRAAKPDAVFSAVKADWWLVAKPAFKVGVPSIVLYLGIQRSLKENVKYKRLFQTFKATLLVNSYSLKDHVMATNRFLTDDNVRVIHNGFTVMDESPTKSVTSLPLPELPKLPRLPKDAFVIGCAGRLAPTKQYRLLADILPKLPDHVHVLLAGEGSEKTNIETALEAAGVEERVHFIGQVPHEAMAEFFQPLDVFLHVSRLEGMANVLNESLSHGVPVVSSDVAGTREATDNGRFGIITPIGDTEASAQGLLSVMRNEFHFEPEEARSWIRAQFSLKKMIDETENLLWPGT